MSETLKACPTIIDNSFGPWAGDCRGGFDFTLLFEESILTIPLLCVFLIVTPFRIQQLIKTGKAVVSSPLRLYKAQTTACLAVLQLVLVVLWARTSSATITHTKATLPTAALSFIVALGLCLLSWYEHARSVRPSFILDIYLALSIIFDTARARTLWLLGPYQTIPILFTCTVALRSVMLILESTEKRGILIPQYKGYSKEATSNTFNRGVFFWLSSLFLKGYGNLLNLDDLFPLDTALFSEPLGRNLQFTWYKVSDPKAPNALLVAWFKASGNALLASVPPRLFQMAFKFAQPFLVNKAIQLSVMPKEQRYDNIGYGLIGAYIFVYFGIGVSTGQYEHRMFRAAVMMRGSLVSLIYHKTLHLDSSATEDKAGLTLMTTDVETIQGGLTQTSEIWACPIEIAIAMYLLFRQLGAACAVPLALTLFIAMVAIGFALPAGKSQAAWIKASEHRVANTSQSLGATKWIRLSGLNTTAFSIIESFRIEELAISSRYRKLLLSIVLLAQTPPILAPVLSFVVFATLANRHHDTLTIAKAFTSLAIFDLLGQPLAVLIGILPNLASSVQSFGRIQEYMNKPGKDTERAQAETVYDGRSTNDMSLTYISPSKAQAPTNGADLLTFEGVFTWPSTEKATLNISSLNIRRGTFTVILGSVGSGKTTLLRCLLGDLTSPDATLHNYARGTAYCAQAAWLPNDSVRHLIAGYSAVNDEWYRTVVKACALEQDIAQFPDGDASIAGSKGVTLSGGQKQRIALARAVYSKKELLILDDVFSGLDSTTSAIVANNLFGEAGLLQDISTTTVLASSDVRYSSAAQRVFVLNEEGDILENAAIVPMLQQVVSATPVGERERRYDNRRPGTSYAPLPNSKAAATLADASQMDLARSLGDSTVYKYYFASAGLIAPLIVSICLVVFAFCSVFPSLWLKWWAEANAVRPNSDLGKWLGVYAAVGVGSVVTLGLSGFVLFIYCVTRSGLYFHSRLVKTVSGAQMSLFSSIDMGITINRFSQDLQLIDMELPIAAFLCLMAVSTIIAMVIMLSVASKYIAVSFPFVVAVFYVVQRFYLRTSRQMRFLDIEYKAPLYSHMLETLSGLATIRSFGWQQQFKEKNIRILDESQQPNYLLFCLQRWLIFSSDMIIAIMAVALISINVTLRDKIGPGYMGIALVNIVGLSTYMKTLLVGWTQLETSIGAVARIKHFVSQTSSEDDVRGQEVRPDTNWPSKGAVEIQALSASYPTSGRVLKDVSLSIRPGEKIGLCGRTGSGKSSLALCLFRLLEIGEGSLKVDDVDLRTLTHEGIRSALVAVPQEACILEGTVRLNADPSRSVPDEDIVHALETVRLWRVIQERGGLDTMLDEKFFSHGEAQLLSLARAMLRKSKILVLDEITTSLGDETSTIIDEVVRTWFADWTVISIAHRLSSILDFNRVVVLDEGEIVEVGDPKVLLASQSRFKDLYDDSQMESSRQWQRQWNEAVASSSNSAGDRPCATVV